MGNHPQHAIWQYFSNLLMPRNHGIVAVIPMAYTYDRRHARIRGDTIGFIVSLGRDHPFMEINCNEEAIVLGARYPGCLAERDHSKEGVWKPPDNYNRSTPVALPKNPKGRRLVTGPLSLYRLRDADASWIKFDIQEPDSLTKAEFFIQTTITRMKYMVVNQGFGRHKIKEDIDFIDPIEFATAEYHKKVVVPRRQ